MHLLQEMRRAIPRRCYKRRAPFSSSPVPLVLGVALTRALGRPDLAGKRLATLWVDFAVNLFKRLRVFCCKPFLEGCCAILHVGHAGAVTISEILETKPVDDCLNIIHERGGVAEAIVQPLEPLKHAILLLCLGNNLRPRHERSFPALVAEDTTLQRFVFESRVRRERIKYAIPIDRPHLRGDVWGLHEAVWIEAGVLLACAGVKGVGATHYGADAMGRATCNRFFV
mmetsp:Transcript_62774/g.168409  ORF Transcript_62774/g.168409 Transcript_62774/m.168409 type:complete len:227 (-) Transcript_62774:315-995(-)